MMKTAKIILSLTAALVMLLTAGCSSSRKATTQTTVATSPAALRYAALDSASLAWSDVNVPISLSISSPTNFSISGSMKMVKGEGVDISLRMLGIEMARILVTTDSIYATYRMKKLYVAQPINLASKPHVSLLLANLQDIFMGRVFIAGESYESVLPPFSLFTAEEIDGMLALTPPAINQNFEYAFFIDSDNHLASTEIALQPYANATIKYSNFTSTQSGILPRLDQFNIVIPKTNVQASIDWKWNSAKWDSGLTLDRTMPNGYTHVTLSDFFAAIFK